MSSLQPSAESNAKNPSQGLFRKYWVHTHYHFSRLHPVTTHKPNRLVLHGGIVPWCKIWFAFLPLFPNHRSEEARDHFLGRGNSGEQAGGGGQRLGRGGGNSLGGGRGRQARDTNRGTSAYDGWTRICRTSSAWRQRPSKRDPSGGCILLSCPPLCHSAKQARRGGVAG